MELETLGKLKLALRISHNKLDEDIQSDVDACLADLTACGVIHPQISDPLIYNAVKLFLRSSYTDDPAKGAEYLKRYEALKSCLRMAEGYGYITDPDEEDGLDD
jgi:hypothetical protein